MGAVGIVGVLLGLLAYRWASVRGERRDFVFFMILPAALAAGVFSYQLAQTSASDSGLYYTIRPLLRKRFRLSTSFVIISSSRCAA